MVPLLTQLILNVWEALFHPVYGCETPMNGYALSTTTSPYASPELLTVNVALIL